MTLSLEKNAFWIIDPNFLALWWQIQMAHYSLFGKQIVNINPSKDQWDSQENKKKYCPNYKGREGQFEKS